MKVNNDLMSYSSVPLLRPLELYTPFLVVSSNAHTALGPLNLFSLPSVILFLQTSAWIALVYHWSLSSEVTSSARLWLFSLKQQNYSPHPLCHTHTHLFPSSSYFPSEFLFFIPSGLFIVICIFLLCPAPPSHKLYNKVYVNFMSVYFVHVCIQEDMPFSLLFLFGSMLEYRGLPSSPYK